MKKNLLVLLLVSAILGNAQIQSIVSTANSPGFRENKGQVSDQNQVPRTDILFSGEHDGLFYFLKKDGISYQLAEIKDWTESTLPIKKPDGLLQTVPKTVNIYRVDVKWINSSSSPVIRSQNPRSDYENFYHEVCPQGALDVKTFSEIIYNNVYSGIDVKWYQSHGTVKYDYLVAAGADYHKIQLEYSGAQAVSVDNNGRLIVTTPLGVIKEERPVVIQAGKMLNAKWIVKDNIVSFDINGVNKTLPLVIDPAIRLWGTYYGGSGMDNLIHTYVNPAGDLFVSGWSQSIANIATTGAHQVIFGGGNPIGDALIAKFDGAGNRIWATYYGGSGLEYGANLASDAAGNIYFAGGTTTSVSAVIATSGAHQVAYSTAPANSSDAMLVKLNPSGARIWGTYYGGDGEEDAIGLAVDNAGNVCIAGETGSPGNISTPGSHQATISAGQDAFLAKFDNNGVRLWGTYFGGNGLFEAIFNCSISSTGDIYICGGTSSSVGISSPLSHQPVYGGGPANGPGDSFLAKFNSSGVRQWATYIGGIGSEQMNNLAFDANGDIYCNGWTSSLTGTAIATPGAHQTIGGNGFDAMFLKFNPAGIRQWGTYYGGTANDYGGGVAVDPSGDLFFSGDTPSSTSTKIATPCAYQGKNNGGGADAFLTKFTSSGTRIWGTYYGGNQSEGCFTCSTDALGNVYIAGYTSAGSGTVMASAASHQPVHGGNGDGFIAKFTGCLSGPPVNTTPPANMLVCAGSSATLSATCGNWYSSPTSTVILASDGIFTTGKISSDTTFYVEDFGCGTTSSNRTAINLTLAPQPIVSITNNNPFPCVNEQIILTGNGANSYLWMTTTVPSATFQAVINAETTYTATGIDINGCSSTTTLMVTPLLCVGIDEGEPAEMNMVLFPNPASEGFNIEITEAGTEIVLRDLSGRVIMAQDILSSGTKFIATRELANGVYVVEISSNGEKTFGRFCKE